MLPNLPTLTTKPSWLNRAGRPDRSSFFALPASSFWPLAEFAPARTFPKRSPATGKLTHRLAAAALPIFFADINHLHRFRLPRRLAGDHRTPKSNALKPPRSPAQLLPCSPALTPPPLHFKILPLEKNWSTTLRLEKWQLHPRLAQHFFVCPHCRRKCLKLFLPLCLKQEYRDALLAHLYLNSLRARRPNAPGSEEERLLHTRYGLLFPPVLPRCRQCLPLRYGEVKKKKPRR